MESLPRCACGCGQPVQRRGKHGPVPIYATKACRQRALRQRQLAAEFTPLPDVIRNAPVPVSTAGTDQQVQRAILELRTIGFAMQRLGITARPELAHRCQRVGDQVIQSLRDNFGEGI